MFEKFALNLSERKQKQNKNIKKRNSTREDSPQIYGNITNRCNCERCCKAGILR